MHVLGTKYKQSVFLPPRGGGGGGGGGCVLVSVHKTKVRVQGLQLNIQGKRSTAARAFVGDSWRAWCACTHQALVTILASQAWLRHTQAWPACAMLSGGTAQQTSGCAHASKTVQNQHCKLLPQQRC